MSQTFTINFSTSCHTTSKHYLVISLHFRCRNWICFAPVFPYMFSKDDQGSLLCCQLCDEPGVEGKAPDVSFIPSVEENRATAFLPVFIWQQRKADQRQPSTHIFVFVAFEVENGLHLWSGNADWTSRSPCCWSWSGRESEWNTSLWTWVPSWSHVFQTTTRVIMKLASWRAILRMKVWTTDALKKNLHELKDFVDQPNVTTASLKT